MVMGRTLVMLFLFVNLILCFYVTYELFRTADYLADAFKILALGGVKPPDFIELKALGIYVFLLGISGFAMALWHIGFMRTEKTLTGLYVHENF